MIRGIVDVVNALPIVSTSQLGSPPYDGNLSKGMALAVESMKSHMTDEGWQIMNGLGQNGYELVGHGFTNCQTDVAKILESRRDSGFGVVVVQDKREWDINHRDFRDKRACFTNVERLKDRTDLFKLTILKDAHQRPEYHKQSAREMGVNAWIVYYHPKIVYRLAPYVRHQHLIRTYHTVDPNVVPAYSARRDDLALLSGAVSSVYPFRSMMVRHRTQLQRTAFDRHPGYHRNGCHTPRYLQRLSQFKVAICTSSIYGYALRKIIEATACGCTVLTDLPYDDTLPAIDGNLVRIAPTSDIKSVNQVIQKLIDEYDPETQKEYAKLAVSMYSFQNVTAKLVRDIEFMRTVYPRSN